MKGKFVVEKIEDKDSGFRITAKKPDGRPETVEFGPRPADVKADAYAKQCAAKYFRVEESDVQVSSDK